MKKVLLSMLVFCLFSNSSFSSESGLTKQIDGLFLAYKKGVRPGYAIAVVDRGELKFAKGYGYANLSREVKIDSNTAFNLASISKQFTGAMVVLAIQKRKLALSDKLARHWPELPEFMSPIQIDHLVYMTSGLPEYYSLPSPVGGWASEDKFTVNNSIEAVFSAERLNYSPGSRWSYSNINYQILAELIAMLGKMSFSTLSSKWLFEPLMMNQTWVDAPIDSNRKNRAKSYEGSRLLGWREAPRLSPHYGGSGVFSSLNDLAKWDRALYYGDTFGNEFRDMMLTTQKFEHDKDNDAFGLVKGEYKGLKTIWYSGSDYGVSTYMVHLPDRQQSVICLANFSEGNCASKARTIIDLLAM